MSNAKKKLWEYRFRLTYFPYAEVIYFNIRLLSEMEYLKVMFLRRAKLESVPKIHTDDTINLKSIIKYIQNSRVQKSDFWSNSHSDRKLSWMLYI